MAEELTYVALKTCKVNGESRSPGSLVPEAADWPRLRAYLERGTIAAVPKTSVNQDDLKIAEAVWEASKPKPEPEVEPEPDPEPAPDTGIEAFSTGSGWYEVPGVEKKLRRDEALAALAELEGADEEE